jgi:hypothetical protein
MSEGQIVTAAETEPCQEIGVTLQGHHLEIALHHSARVIAAVACSKQCGLVLNARAIGSSETLFGAL